MLENENAKSEVLTYFTEHVVAAVAGIATLATALGYSCAYIARIGFCQITKIPPELIEPGWTDAAQATSPVIGFAIWLPATMALRSHFDAEISSSSWPSFRMVCGYALAYTAIAVPILIAFPQPATAWAICMGLSAAAGFAHASNLVHNRGNSSLPAGLRHSSIALITLSFSWIASRDSALHREDFLVVSATNSHDELVILHINKDRAIAAPLDREHRQFKREFRIIELSAGVALRQELLLSLQPDTTEPVAACQSPAPGAVAQGNRI